MQQTTDRTKRRKLHNECGGPGPNSWGITGYATEGNSFETILKDERRRIGAVGFAIRAKVRVSHFGQGGIGRRSRPIGRLLGIGQCREWRMEKAKNGETYQGGGRLPFRHSRESRKGNVRRQTITTRGGPRGAPAGRSVCRGSDPGGWRGRTGNSGEEEGGGERGSGH
jgi:hypothetical protein